MEYFISKTESMELLETLKREYQKDHDKFHQYNIALLDIDTKRDSFYDFLKKIILLDIQSRPMLLTKHDVYRVYDEIETRFSKLRLKEEFDGNALKLRDFLYSELTSIENIGNKIAFLIVKNICYFGDTMKYFGVQRYEIIPLLKAPIDIHVKTLLCYRFKISPEDKFERITSENNKFQQELEEICRQSKEINPIDLDLLWYIGYHNCNKRVYCPKCRMRPYCRDPYFEVETRKKVSDESRSNREIAFVKNHPEIEFS